MATTKTKIIKRYGNVITIISRTPQVSTKAIVGSSVRKTSVRLADVEKFLRGDFLVTDNILNGEVIQHVVTGVKYMVLGLFREVIVGVRTMDLCNLLKINGVYSCSRLVESADDNGNKTKISTFIVQDAPTYTEPVTDEMRQTDLGLLENAEFLMYSPALTIAVGDQVSLNSNGIDRTFRVGAIDNIALEGILILQLITDIRGK